MTRKRRLATAAAFLVAATAGSRVLGLVREIVMVYVPGPGRRHGGLHRRQQGAQPGAHPAGRHRALSAAFIPVFSELLEKERRREAWQVAYTVTVLATVVLGRDQRSWG